MEVQQNDHDHGGTPGRPFQYSLRTLLAVTAFLAVSCSLLFASPGWVRVLTALCLAVVLPGVLTVGLVYGRGYTRTFCLGALFPSGLTLVSAGLILAVVVWAIAVSSVSDLADLEKVGYGPGILIAISWGLSILVGLLAVGVRWKIEGPRRREQEAGLRAERSEASGSEAATAAES